MSTSTTGAVPEFPPASVGGKAEGEVMANNRQRSIWFVDRGFDKPASWGAEIVHHRYIVCTEQGRAYREANSPWSQGKASIWHHDTADNSRVAGWLRLRWNGLDIDYGYLVSGWGLPDGSRTGFVHPRTEPPWSLLHRAVWWSERAPLRWLEELGVAPLPDEYSRELVKTSVDRWNGPHHHYVMPGEEVAALGDWLEERGYADAAREMRGAFLRSGA